jgi:hypothetical protein
MKSQRMRFVNARHHGITKKLNGEDFKVSLPTGRAVSPKSPRTPRGGIPTMSKTVRP